MSSLFRDKKDVSRGWGEIAVDFLEVFRDKISLAVRVSQLKILKTLISLILALIGFIFFLNGLAAFLGELLHKGWFGYLVVGIILMFIGWIMNGKNKF